MMVRLAVGWCFLLGMNSWLSKALQVLGYNSYSFTGEPETEKEFLAVFKYSGSKEINWVEIQARIAELQAAEPMRLLREQRNQLLQKSDWMAVADRTMTQAQIDYRQALRDLPETADPQLDENGQLTNVTWPVYE
jgi:hypothetical protein